MHNNIADGERVKDVVMQSSLSRRMLDLMFKKHLGRTVSSELQRLRMQRAKRLLEPSYNSIPDASKEAGHTSPINMYRAFLKYEDRVPKDYRKRHRKKTLADWNFSNNRPAAEREHRFPTDD